MKPSRSAIGRFTSDTWLLTAIWGVTLYRAAAFWGASPDNAYGFVVPFLAAHLLVNRHRHRPVAQTCRFRGTWLGLTCFWAALWGGANFLLTAFPQWPAAGWILLLAAIALSLSFYANSGGAAWTIHFAFPFAFLLTSLPLPAALRQPTLDAMTPTVTLWATTIVNEIGIPALRHGTIIEVAHGFVGIEAACAGLRSVEATLMVSLFFGEYWMMPFLRRVALVLAGGLCAIAGNVLRIVILTWTVARPTLTGAPAWHEFAGYGALIATLGGVLVAALILRPSAITNCGNLGNGNEFRRRPRLFTWIYGIAVASCLAPVVWFGAPVARATGRAEHRIDLPETDPSFQTAAVASTAALLLHCDRVVAGRWLTADEAPCTGYVIRWRHGHEAQFALALHNPEICLPYAGLQRQRALPDLPITATPLTCRGWEFASATARVAVYSTTFRVPSLARLPDAPVSAAEWWRCRMDAVQRRERDEDVANVTLVFDVDDAAPSRVAAEMGRVIRRTP